MTASKTPETGGKQATPEDLCASTLAHYEDVSARACHWNNQVPQAIKHWFLEKPAIERRLADALRERDEARLVARVAETGLAQRTAGEMEWRERAEAAERELAALTAGDCVMVPRETAEKGWVVVNRDGRLHRGDHSGNIIVYAYRSQAIMGLRGNQRTELYLLAAAKEGK